MRTSLLAGMVGVHAFQGTRWTVAGEVPGPAGDHHPAIAPYGLFRDRLRAGPGGVRLGGVVARAVRRVTGLDPADGRFATNAERVANRTT